MPQAVVLKSVGSYTSTTVVNLNNPSVHAYTLLGNPYPSEISFTTFQTDNGSVISNKAWLYSGKSTNTTDIYSAWNNGQVAGFGLPPENLGTLTGNTYSDLIISSGSAFFVEAKTAGSVTFAENQKSNQLASGNPIFSKIVPPASWTDYIRIHLLKASDSIEIDNAIIRYLDDQEISNTVYGEMDSYSLNPVNASVASLKSGSRMSIQTRRLDFVNDTVAIAVGSTAGNYRLSFSEYEGFAKAANIFLIDNYLHTTTNVKKQVEGYAFSINTDPLSQGTKRFALVFGAPTVLPLQFMYVQALGNAGKVKIDWKVANEVNVKEYQVERSVDGVHFTHVEEALPATKNIDYTITDSKPATGINYYHINAIDFDGKITSSKTVTVELGQGAIVYKLFPNPVRERLLITIQYPEDKHYILKILSVSGKPVIMQKGTINEGGTITVNTAALPQGVYIADLTFETGGQHYAQKFVK